MADSFTENRKPKTENTAPPRTVIFTADDFGLSAALNAAVAIAHSQGLLSCASLMAAAPATNEAREIALQHPDLCLGVHLTLIQGRAVLPPRHLPHLVDNNGNFPNDPVRAGWRYFWEPRLLPELRREMAAQIESLLAGGLKVWHLNGHLNLHLHPRIFPIVVELCREYGIAAVRLCREDWRLTLRLAPEGPLPKVMQGLIFAWLSRRAARLAQAAGLAVNDHLFGLTQDGRMTEDYVLGLIPGLKPGVTEIYCHPATHADVELKRWAPHYQRQAELQALLSPRIRRELTAAGIKVSDYRELSQGKPLAGATAASIRTGKR
jgi:hopanoid biosynthesis associated protein HpnK